MMIKYSNRFCISFIFLIVMQLASQLKVNAQNSCSQTLKLAQKNYESGLLQQIPSKLEGCMKTGFTKQEQIQAYRLIILTYIFLDEQALAEKTMNNLLNYEPDFRPSKDLDPIEFVALYERFRVEPFISFGLMFGVNRTMPRLVNSFGVGNTDSKPTEYTQSFAIQPIGVIADFLLYRNLFLTTEATVVLRQFGSKNQVFTTADVFSTENQLGLDVPISFKYVIGKRNLKFFIRAGGVANILISSQAELVRRKTDQNSTEQTGPFVDFIKQRNNLNLSLLGGIGAMYKIGYGFLILDARFTYGITNVANTEMRYSNFNEQILKYGYIDSNFALSSAQVSIGYMYSLYHVKKNKLKAID